MQALIRKPGSEGVQQRITSLNNKTISKYDYQKVQDLMADLAFEDVRDANKDVAAFYSWVSYCFGMQDGIKI